MSNRITLTEEVIEGTNRPLTFTIVDVAGSPLTPATLTLTLHDANTGTLLGGRQAQQNVLNTNGVTVSSGVVTWQPTPEDNVIVSTSRLQDEELHVALWEWTWADGAVTRREKQEVAFWVVNLGKVPV